MEKIKTVQEHEKLNEVYRAEEPDENGLFHTYIIAKADVEGEDYFSDNPILAILRFQKGPRSEKKSLPGVLEVDLIEIVRDRLKTHQKGKYACQENAVAIGYLEAALAAMNDRIEDRIKRGVLGKKEK